MGRVQITALLSYGGLPIGVAARGFLLCSVRWFWASIGARPNATGRRPWPRRLAANWLRTQVANPAW